MGRAPSWMGEQSNPPGKMCLPWSSHKTLQKSLKGHICLSWQVMQSGSQ